MSHDIHLNGHTLRSPIKSNDTAFTSPIYTGAPSNRSMDQSPSSNGPSDSNANGSNKRYRPSTTTSIWVHYTDRRSISDTHWEVKCLHCDTCYKIKKDGSTGTSTLHKHHRQCQEKAKSDGSPLSKQASHHGSASTSSSGGGGFRLSHDYTQHDGGGSPTNHPSTSSQPLTSYPPALQDYIFAAQQQNHGADPMQQSQASASALGLTHTNGFDLAASMADAAHFANNFNARHEGQGAVLGEGIDVMVLNPNSSEVITQNLEQLLEPSRAWGVKHTYRTGPPSAPPSINDPPTSILSAHATFEDLRRTSALADKSAVLVCCFSAHPLVPMIRHEYPHLPCMHILDTAINHAMSCGANTFGVITTGKAMIPDIDAGVRSYIGGVSDRYKGCVATGLGVLELGDPSFKERVESKIKEDSARLALERGAEAIILGCAGMAGMESLVRQGIQEAGGSLDKIWVIDGAKAGVQLLAGLARSNYRS